MLFLQLIMRKLHRDPTIAGRPARAAVVVPNGVLSSPGVAERLRMNLLNDFTINAIVRLPHNVFAPYTDIKTNILFLERGGPAKEIFYCEPRVPDDYSLSKTRPLLYEMLKPLVALLEGFKETDLSWIVRRDQIDENLNLDIKNPRLQLSDLSESESIEFLAEHLRALAAQAETIQAGLASAIEAVQTAPLRPLGKVTFESDERIGKAYTAGTKLLGVSAEEGICEPKTKIGSNPERYKVLRTGYLAYNPMRINIGSIGFIRETLPAASQVRTTLSFIVARTSARISSITSCAARRAGMPSIRRQRDRYGLGFTINSWL